MIKKSPIITYALFLIIAILTPNNLLAQDDTSNQRLDFTQDPRFYVIGDIEITGLSKTDENTLLGTLNLEKGDSISIPGDQLRTMYRRLWDLQLFSDVKIETSFQGDTVDLSINLKERKRVVKWQFKGVNATEEKELKEKLKLRRYSPYSDYLLNTSMRLIREYYNTKAYRNAKIDYTLDKDTLSNGDCFVTFNVVKGKKMRIGEITFEGNENVATKGLRKSMKNTNKVSINIFKKTKFDDKEFPNDLLSVVDHLRSKGFRDGMVVADSLYTIPGKDNRIGVWVKIEEGKKYYFRNITWLGNSKYTSDRLNELLQLEDGDVYDGQALESRLGLGMADPSVQSVASLYRDGGYLAFVIEPIETVVSGDSVDVEIRMIEGHQFRINNVSFEGNTRTNDHVIRRELSTDPGELYSQSLLMRSYQRLASMGQFDPATIVPEQVPNFQAKTVDIKYTFKEIPNDQLELSGGWGGGMFIASIGLNFTNVSARKLFDKESWKPYPAGDGQTLSLKLQSNGTYYQAFSIGFTEPWLGGRKPNALSVSFFTSRESNAYIIGANASKFFGTIGGSVSLGKRLTWPDPYFTMSAGISVQSYKLEDWDYFLMKNGQSNTVALNFSIGRNSVDDPMMYPTMGSNMSLSLAITPPFSAFDKMNYADPNLSQQDRYRWIEYHKWKLNAQWFFPLDFSRKFVLMARAQYGYLGNFDQDKKSPFEGFVVGGDGLSGYNLYGTETIGLRGYENGALTPASNSGLYASIYSKYTVEVRYPIMRQGQTLVYALAFAEAGNAYMDVKDFKPFNLKRSFGAGLRIFLPIIGMLGIDWGYGLDRANNTVDRISGSQFHFTLGAQL